MRIAVMIIALCLVMLIGLQSCTVMVGGGLGDDADMAAGGAVGIFVAFLFLLGAAFAIGAPKASMIIFIIAALLGFGSGAGSAFSDMTVWGYVSAGLAAMSYFGMREKQKLETKTA